MNLIFETVAEVSQRRFLRGQIINTNLLIFQLKLLRQDGRFVLVLKFLKLLQDFRLFLLVLEKTILNELKLNRHFRLLFFNFLYFFLLIFNFVLTLLNK